MILPLLLIVILVIVAVALVVLRDDPVRTALPTHLMHGHLI
jgi:hypothetical protein